MRPLPWAMAGRPAKAAPRPRGLDLPRVSAVQLSGGVRVWEFTTSMGTVAALSNPALDEALAGVRLGELVVDSSNARDLLNRISVMDTKVANAKTLSQSNPTAVAPFGLAASIASWYSLRDSTRTKVDAVSAAATKALLLGTPQSAPDDGVSALNDLENRASDIDDTAQMVRAQLPSTTPGGTVIPTPGTAATVTSSTFLGLPWWAWVIFGLGGVGLLALIATAAGGGGSPAVVVAER